jgi:hypothetical protein
MRCRILARLGLLWTGCVGAELAFLEPELVILVLGIAPLLVLDAFALVETTSCPGSLLFDRVSIVVAHVAGLPTSPVYISTSVGIA